MSSENPYRSPEAAPEPSPRQASGASTSRKIAPGSLAISRRYFAASVDAVGSIVLAIIVVMQIPESMAVLRVAAIVLVYLSYFFIPEWLFGRTLGKWLTGIRIARLDGSRPGIWPTTVRTLLRVVEVNPILLGGAPAALFIFASKQRQRLGDTLAGTLVIPAKYVIRVKP